MLGYTLVHEFTDFGVLRRLGRANAFMPLGNTQHGNSMLFTVLGVTQGHKHFVRPNLQVKHNETIYYGASTASWLTQPFYMLSARSVPGDPRLSPVNPSADTAG